MRESLEHRFHKWCSDNGFDVIMDLNSGFNIQKTIEDISTNHMKRFLWDTIQLFEEYNQFCLEFYYGPESEMMQKANYNYEEEKP